MYLHLVRVGVLWIFFTRLSILFYLSLSLPLSLADGPIETEILSQRAVERKTTE